MAGFFGALAGSDAIGDALGLSQTQQNGLFMAMNDTPTMSHRERITAALRARYGSKWTDEELLDLYVSDLMEEHEEADEYFEDEDDEYDENEDD